jgi:hypothetical protein
MLAGIGYYHGRLLIRHTVGISYISVFCEVLHVNIGIDSGL